jgi:hypothetical protein
VAVAVLLEVEDAVLLEAAVRLEVGVEMAEEEAAAVNEAREVAVATELLVAVSLTCSLRFLRIAAASSVVKMERRTSRKRKGMRNDNAKSTAAVCTRARSAASTVLPTVVFAPPAPGGAVAAKR